MKDATLSKSSAASTLRRACCCSGMPAAVPRLVGVDEWLGRYWGWGVEVLTDSPPAPARSVKVLAVALPRCWCNGSGAQRALLPPCPGEEGREMGADQMHGGAGGGGGEGGRKGWKRKRM
eukprot:1325086-Rhodomonas_salina.1